MKPERRPQRPHLSSGPCAKRPGWSLAGLEKALLGRSHRAGVAKKRSTDELDYTEALDYYGLRFRPVDPRNQRAFLRATTHVDNGRLIVTGVRRDTPAFDAGLNTDDEILAVDGVRVPADALATRLEQ